MRSRRTTSWKPPQPITFLAAAIVAISGWSSSSCGDDDGSPAPCVDSDEDTVCDEFDHCPGDDDTLDGDGDGVADCLDECPADPEKTAVGRCGCGTPDTDSDGDGELDCEDLCPADPLNDADQDGICADEDPCPADPSNDIDQDGVCGDVDRCPDVSNPLQVVGDSARCPGLSCLDILTSGQTGGDGIYWIVHASEATPIPVFCDMTRHGGGWTLIAVYGTEPRPTQYWGLDYPRHGASFFGHLEDQTIDGTLDATGLLIFEPEQNARSAGFSHYAIDASDLWVSSNHEVLAWVGGETDDYITATPPGGCNFFNGDTWCAEDTFGPFAVLSSDGTVITHNAYACTSSFGENDNPHDLDYYEFGFHLIDGIDALDGWNCNQTTSPLGHQDVGRIFTPFQSYVPTTEVWHYWDLGVYAHWKEDGLGHEPGALLIR